MNELFDANARDRALIRSVLVVGGTTAGWMTACYLKRAFPGLQISLLEAHDQESWEPPQGTRPDFQSLFFDVLGVSEDEWMRCCAGSFRVATKHQNWRLPASETPDDYYYQLFEPMPDCDSLPLSHYWVQDRLRGERQPMAYACHKEPRVLDVKLAPRYRDGSRAMSYAWHVDSQLLTTFLQRMAVDWGVQRIPEELGRVELTVGGAIRGIVTTQGNALSADLFVDCSGARRALAGALREPFIDMSDHLACDQVMTSTFSNDDALEGVDPYTSTIALSCGWAWKIPRLGRFDAGYVHCSQLIGAAEAAEELCSLWGFDPALRPLTQTPFRVGRSSRAWVQNCVCIGSSAACIEPLEASSIDFVCAGLQQLARYFPDTGFAPVLREHFNRAIATRFDEIRDLTQLHYLASPRQDSEFWRRSQHDATVSPRAQGALDAYGLDLPAGYHVLAGMGLLPERALPFVRYRADSREKAQQMFEQIRQRSDRLYAELPTNYELLRELHAAS